MSPRFDHHRLACLATRLQADVETGAIAGADVLIGDRERDRWRCTIGVRDVAHGDRLRGDAIWRIYSMTKVLVSAATMVLAEKGLLRLDQPVSDFFPAFAGLKVAVDGALRPIHREPTVQDLLRHTAGLSYAYLGDSAAQRAYAADGFFADDLTNADYVARLAALPLDHEPGTVWHYSHATDVLGHVLEQVCGSTLQDVLDRSLLHPLGMANTLFCLPAGQRGRVAEPLPQQAGQRPLFHDPCLPRRGQRGNGGLVSTMDDYAQFLRMMLNEGQHEGKRLLAPSSVRLMCADHLGTAISPGAYYPPGPGYGFGLGVAVRIVAGEAAYPGSLGDWFWSGVGGTYFWVDPASGFFTIVMMQTSSPQQRLHYRSLARAMVYAALS